MKNKIIVFCGLLSLVLLLNSFSSNPPDGRTGAPGEPTCMGSGCHTTNPGIRGVIRISGWPEMLTENTNYALKVNLDVTSGRAFRGGFQMTILNQNNMAAGVLLNPGESSMISESNGRQYFEHEPAQSFGNDTTVTYSVVWTTPPLFNQDTFTMYISSILSNGDGGNTLDGFVRANFARIVVACLPDADNDGFKSDVDCDDTNPLINPDAIEILDNDVDENCDGLIEMSPPAPSVAQILRFRTPRGNPIPEIMVRLSADSTLVGISSSSGLVQIPDSLGANRYTFDKTGMAIDGMTASDIVIMTNHILNITPITDPNLLDAADINLSGTISASDIVQMRNVLLAIWDSFPSRKVWAFNPSNLTFPLSSTSDTLDVIGYKIGDINGSFIP